MCINWGGVRGRLFKSHKVQKRSFRLDTSFFEDGESTIQLRLDDLDVYVTESTQYGMKRKFPLNFKCTLEVGSLTSEEFKKIAPSLVKLRQSHKEGTSLQPLPRASKAPHPAGVTNRIRGLVSKKKLRFQQDGFDLDLSYITDHIIAMGYPSQGLEGTYRNQMKDVQKFFQTYHQGNFKIYNLCSERKYDPQSFKGQGGEFAHYGFDDHNPPRFELLPKICEDAMAFLNAAPGKNTVAFHCKAGKGRTGTVICCLLIYLRLWTTAEEALEFYGAARTANRKGVTIPSQRRYVTYFEKWYDIFGV